jgi:hypothetical protein
MGMSLKPGIILVQVKISEIYGCYSPKKNATAIWGLTISPSISGSNPVAGPFR